MQDRSNRRAAILRIIGITGLPAIARALGWNQDNGFPTLVTRSFSVPLTGSDGTVSTRYDASAVGFTEDLGKGVSLDLNLVPSGTFLMGSEDPTLYAWEPLTTPVHRVSIPTFAIGIYPVTCGQWMQVATYPTISRALSPPFYSSRWTSEQLQVVPQDAVNPYELVEFLARLSVRTGRNYRLPSEAEWECSCRAATRTEYHFGDAISRHVANVGDGTEWPIDLSPVGKYNAPNRYGLHDMHGNVMEECTDWAFNSYEGAPTDGSARLNPGGGPNPVARGGGYLFREGAARSAYRYPMLAAYPSGFGFRVAVDVPYQFIDPVVAAGSFSSAASRLIGVMSPGEWISVDLKGIGPSADPLNFSANDAGVVSGSLGGCRVLVNGVAASMIQLSKDALVFAVPYATDPGSAAAVVVSNQGQTSAPVQIAMAPARPAVYSVDGTGTGLAVAMNEDGSPNGPGNGAIAGSTLAMTVTGMGPTVPAGVDGLVATDSTPVFAPALPVLVTIGGVEAPIRRFASVTGSPTGILRLLVLVPSGLSSGPMDVVLTVGDATSPPGVFVIVT